MFLNSSGSLFQIPEGIPSTNILFMFLSGNAQKSLDDKIIIADIPKLSVKSDKLSVKSEK